MGRSGRAIGLTDRAERFGPKDSGRKIRAVFQLTGSPSPLRPRSPEFSPREFCPESFAPRVLPAIARDGLRASSAGGPVRSRRETPGNRENSAGTGWFGRDRKTQPSRRGRMWENTTSGSVEHCAASDRQIESRPQRLPWPVIPATESRQVSPASAVSRPPRERRPPRRPPAAPFGFGAARFGSPRAPPRGSRARQRLSKSGGGPPRSICRFCC